MARIILAALIALIPGVAVAQSVQAPAILQLKANPSGARSALGLAPSATTDTTNAANISAGTLPAARLPTPSASTLGGVQSSVGASHQWLSGISTAGVPALSQPAFGDISGLGTAATANTGTSGAAIPLLNGANTWGANQSMLSLDNTLYCSQFVSLQACHDALPSTGGKMLLPPNTTYALTSRLNISKPNVTIQCPNWNTVIQRSGSSNVNQIINITGAGNVVRDCTIDGNGQGVGVAQGTGGGEISLASANGLLDHINVINSANSISVLVSGQNSALINSTITGLSSATLGGYGVWAIGHVPVRIDGNTVSGTTIDAIGFDGVGSRVTNNHVFSAQCFATIVGNAGGQIAAYPGYANMLVANNTVDQGCAAYSGGIEANGSSLTITGNVLNNQMTNAIAVASNAVGTLISGNTVRNAGQGGGANTAAIILQASAKNVTITGNRVIDDQGTPTTIYGVEIVSNNDNLTIVGNDFTGAVTPIGGTTNAQGKKFSIRDNIGIDGVIPSIATGNVVVIGYNPVIALTGTATVNWIDVGTTPGPLWTGRVLTILPAAVFNITSAGNVANAVTTAANVPIVATWDGTLWHLK